MRLIRLNQASPGNILTSPLILPRIPLMMNPLLNNMLMLGIIRIHHLNGLPPPPPLRRIRPLERKTRQQRRQRPSLRIHTRLDELLRAAQVGIAVDYCPGAGHGGDPEAEEERVAVLGGPFLGALEGGFVLFEEGCAALFALEFGFLLGVVLDVESCGGAVGGDDGC